jgi:hypothetical protein
MPSNPRCCSTLRIPSSPSSGRRPSLPRRCLSPCPWISGRAIIAAASPWLRHDQIVARWIDFSRLGRQERNAAASSHACTAFRWPSRQRRQRPRRLQVCEHDGTKCSISLSGPTVTHSFVNCSCYSSSSSLFIQNVAFHPLCLVQCHVL